MEERTINRGEVWWISVDDSVGGEQQTGRPALVLSTRGTSAIHNTYTVAYMTKGGFASPVMPSVIFGGTKHRVLCNQLRTLDGSRFTKLVTTLSSADMTRIGGALASALGLQPPTKQEETEAYVEAESEELAVLRVDAAMYKRMYEKVLDQLVELRVETDMAKRMVIAEPEVVEEPVEVVEDPEPEPELPKFLQKNVELNTCEMADLLDIGVNEDVATRLIEGRPWKNIQEIRRVDGLTSMMYAVLSQVLVVVPVAVEEPEVVEVIETRREYTWDEFKNLSEDKQKEYLDYRRITLGESESEIATCLGTKVQSLYNYTNKHPALLRTGPKPQKKQVEAPEGAMVNINTATPSELMEKLGMQKTDAYRITGHRKKHGLFGDVEELLLVEKFSKKKFEMYRAYFTVEDVASDPPENPSITPAPVVKFNINTASAYELQKAGFNKTQAHKIVGSRKYNGPFYELDDLLNVDGIKKKDIRKLRDVLEV